MPRNVRADELIRYLNESPSPYHAVAAAKRRLEESAATALEEGKPWKFQAGDSAYVIRGGSSVAAIRIPKSFSPEQPPTFRIAAAHTDSPGLRLKPKPAETLHKYRRWAVEVYGGALYNSWLDRDLGIAGRICHIGENSSEPKLLRLEDQPVRIPQLAIHLDRKVNEEGLILNAQNHLVPVLGQAAGSSLESLLESAAGSPFGNLSFDLCLYDRTPACYGGLGDEFIYSGRLDNLAMCHAALSAFLEAAPAADVIQVIALFNHEEVGSVSAQAAESNFLASFLERAGLALGLNRETWLSLLPQSFLISTNMAHGVHPNYPDKHEPDHFPVPNRGVVLKSNAGHRYASDGPTVARFLGWARQAGVATQNFLSRADFSCGTTVGPGLSAQLGIPTVDAGTAMLSMHSAREMCGADDHGQMIAVLKEFFKG